MPETVDAEDVTTWVYAGRHATGPLLTIEIGGEGGNYAQCLKNWPFNDRPLAGDELIVDIGDACAAFRVAKISWRMGEFVSIVTHREPAGESFDFVCQKLSADGWLVLKKKDGDQEEQA